MMHNQWNEFNLIKDIIKQTRPQQYYLFAHKL